MANWSSAHNAYLPGKSRSMRADGAPKSYGNHNESNSVKAKKQKQEKNPKSREMCNQCHTNKSHETAKDMPGAPHHLKGSAKRITGIENLSEKQK